MRLPFLLASLLLPAALSAQASPALTLWKAGSPAFGIFVPSERAPGATDANGKRLPPLYTAEGAKALGANPLHDYLFLNLEGAYDVEAVKAMVAGLKASSGHPTLLVRIPTIEAAGAEPTRARVKEVLALGADGVVIPHVRSATEAALAVSFFTDLKANVWSPKNPAGTVIAMLMIEDKGAVTEMQAIAAVPGYSLLSCGIGSLTRDMGGDAPGAETACKNVRDAGAKLGMPSMMTANDKTIGDRLSKGYLGLLMAGTAEQTDAIIRTGRELAKRK
jgi:2-keto-3-deoxy-L-rhamnonate aldolase RhmA